jgi:hypothetical protein
VTEDVESDGADVTESLIVLTHNEYVQSESPTSSTCKTIGSGSTAFNAFSVTPQATVGCNWAPALRRLPITKFCQWQ